MGFAEPYNGIVISLTIEIFLFVIYWGFYDCDWYKYLVSSVKYIRGKFWFAFCGTCSEPGVDALEHVRWCSSMIVLQTVALIVLVQDFTPEPIIIAGKTKIALFGETGYSSPLFDPQQSMLIFIYFVTSLIPLLWMFAILMKKTPVENSMGFRQNTNTTIVHHFDKFTVVSARILTSFFTIIVISVFSASLMGAIPGQVRELTSLNVTPYQFKTEQDQGILQRAVLEVISVEKESASIPLRAAITPKLNQAGWYIARMELSEDDDSQNRELTEIPAIEFENSPFLDFIIRGNNGLKKGDIITLKFYLKKRSDNGEYTSRDEVLQKLQDGVYSLKITGLEID